jgi:hypothetical protein
MAAPTIVVTKRAHIAAKAVRAKIEHTRINWKSHIHELSPEVYRQGGIIFEHNRCRYATARNVESGEAVLHSKTEGAVPHDQSCLICAARVQAGTRGR